ncbi:MAG: DoxX family membrane protein [Deltaproteobacteria bacterium]|nr:DoxX family membrane protein [Deltaproteobacteria bacterium]
MKPLSWTNLPTHPLLALAFRLYLGGLFIYASLNKINYTAEFAETIASYQLVPYWGVNLMAVILPWIELISGILLVIGIRTRTVAAVVGFLLLLFTFGIVYNLILGSEISCGCFESLEDPISLWTVFRDLLWFAMAVHVFFFDRAFQVERRFLPAIPEVQE